MPEPKRREIYRAFGWDMKETREEYEARKEREYEEFMDRERERENNRYAKQRLVSRAESISGTTDFKSGSAEMHELMQEWKSIGSAGKDNNDELWADFQSARQKFFDRREEAKERREREMEKSRSTKQGIVSRARSVSRTNDFKSGSAEFADLREEWKAAGFSGRESEDDLWNQFQAAQKEFYERRDAAREKRNQELERNRSAKRSIVNRAKSLSSSTDFRTTASEFSDLRQEWKGIGFSGKDSDNELWDEFQAAQQKFFTAREQFREKRVRELAANADVKRRLISKGNELLQLQDSREARKAFAELRQRWKEIGSAGDKDQELWGEFSAIGDALHKDRLFNDPKNAMQRLSKQIDRDFSQKLQGEIERQNKRAVSSITGGYKPFGASDGKRHGHHSDPKQYGGDPRQKLTSMDANEHRAFHSDNRAWRATKQWSKNTPRERNVEITADQYDLTRNKYPKAARDFFEQHPQQDSESRDRNEKATDFVRGFKSKDQK